MFRLTENLQDNELPYTLHSNLPIINILPHLSPHTHTHYYYFESKLQTMADFTLEYTFTSAYISYKLGEQRHFLTYPVIKYRIVNSDTALLANTLSTIYRRLFPPTFSMAAVSPIQEPIHNQACL